MRSGSDAISFHRFCCFFSRVAAVGMVGKGQFVVETAQGKTRALSGRSFSPAERICIRSTCSPKRSRGMYTKPAYDSLSASPPNQNAQRTTQNTQRTDASGTPRATSLLRPLKPPSAQHRSIRVVALSQLATTCLPSRPPPVIVTLHQYRVYGKKPSSLRTDQ